MTDDIQEVIADPNDSTHTVAAEEMAGMEAQAASENAMEASSDEGNLVAAPASSSASLILRRGGADTDVSFPLAGSSLIGRFDPSVGPIDVDLGSLTPEGTYVSRKHAKIVYSDGAWTIQDLGSSNGTFVLRDDFERVTESELTDGQEIAFGNARFVFRLNPEPVEA